MFFLPANITIKDLKVNNVDHFGAVSFTSTVKQNRNVNAKKNQGFGQQMADDSVRAFTVSSTTDDEAEDTTSKKTTW